MVRWLCNDYLGLFLWAVERTKETDSCVGARASKGLHLHLHSLRTAIPVAATAPASPFARPLPRRVPAAPSMRRKHEKEKTKCSTRFPNGRLETTCSSSTRYAHIRLARTRKKPPTVDTARAEERRGRARAWQTSLSVDSETLNSAVRAASSFQCSRPPFVVVKSAQENCLHTLRRRFHSPLLRVLRCNTTRTAPMACEFPA
jgi:hypothetical protein